MEKQVKTIKILKKNRKYFAAEENGYKLKILIDENSEKLETGEYTLELEDISKRSKYGVDVIYRIADESKIEKDAWKDVIIVECEYNKHFVESARKLGGKWDKEKWTFSKLVADEAEELDFIYSSKKIPIEIKAKKNIYTDRSPLYFCGIELGRAYGRDSGANISDGIHVVSGDLTSAGSRANWNTKVEEETVIRLFIPEEVLNIHFEEEQEKWDLKRL